MKSISQKSRTIVRENKKETFKKQDEDYDLGADFNDTEIDEWIGTDTSQQNTKQSYEKLRTEIKNLIKPYTIHIGRLPQTPGFSRRKVLTNLKKSGTPMQERPKVTKVAKPAGSEKISYLSRLINPRNLPRSTSPDNGRKVFKIFIPADGSFIPESGPFKSESYQVRQNEEIKNSKPNFGISTGLLINGIKRPLPIPPKILNESEEDISENTKIVGKQLQNNVDV